MKTLTTLFLILFLAMTNLAAQQPDISGFGGYAYDSGIDFIRIDMQHEGFELVRESGVSLWYTCEYERIECEIGYIFDDGLMISGIMVFDWDPGPDNYANIAAQLHTFYNVAVKFELKDQVATQILFTGDSKITHRRNEKTKNHYLIYRNKEYVKKPEVKAQDHT